MCFGRKERPPGRAQKTLEWRCFCPFGDKMRRTVDRTRLGLCGRGQWLLVSEGGTHNGLRFEGPLGSRVAVGGAAVQTVPFTHLGRCHLHVSVLSARVGDSFPHRVLGICEDPISFSWSWLTFCCGSGRGPSAAPCCLDDLAQAACPLPVSLCAGDHTTANDG